MTDHDLLATKFGTFQLRRDEHAKDGKVSGRAASLKAWNAADEYLLDTLYSLLDISHSLLILNDHFGALTTSLAKFSPTFVSDSFCAKQACINNLRACYKNEDLPIQFSDCLNIPPHKVDFIILQIPKSNALLEDQLYRLRETIQPSTKIIARAMTKHLHKNTLKLFEEIIGPTHTSLAKKKARLIFCQPEPSNWKGSSPYPSSYEWEKGGLRFLSHANVFSQDHLDIGTRLFLENIQNLPLAKHIIDLACGNGILGVAAKLILPDARVQFYDESYMAIASAKENYRNAFPNSEKTRDATFMLADCLGTAPPNSADLILSNPPFHQQHTLDDEVAGRMFKQSKKVLKKGGELWVVGNRHLNYHLKLKRLYNNCDVVASNRKFVLLKAVKCG